MGRQMASALWPFEDPQNFAVFVTREVLRRDEPILLVTHGEGEDSWSFIGSSDGTLENGLVISLEESVAIDPTVRQLADLRTGWQARRSSANAAWIREPQPDAI